MIEVWRIVKTRYADRAFDGEGAHRSGGRRVSVLSLQLFSGLRDDDRFVALIKRMKKTSRGCQKHSTQSPKSGESARARCQTGLRLNAISQELLSDCSIGIRQLKVVESVTSTSIDPPCARAISLTM